MPRKSENFYLMIELRFDTVKLVRSEERFSKYWVTTDLREDNLKFGALLSSCFCNIFGL